LPAEADDARAATVGDEERRDAAAGNQALEVAADSRRFAIGPDYVRSAGAARDLHHPVFGIGWRLPAERRMRDAERRAVGGKRFGILDPADRGAVTAGERETARDLVDELGLALEPRS
jgi:hypothetical protein